MPSTSSTVESDEEDANLWDEILRNGQRGARGRKGAGRGVKGETKKRGLKPPAKKEKSQERPSVKEGVQAAPEPVEQPTAGPSNDSTALPTPSNPSEPSTATDTKEQTTKGKERQVHSRATALLEKSLAGIRAQRDANGVLQPSPGAGPSRTPKSSKKLADKSKGKAIDVQAATEQDIAAPPPSGQDPNPVQDEPLSSSPQSISASRPPKEAPGPVRAEKAAKREAKKATVAATLEVASASQDHSPAQDRPPSDPLLSASTGQSSKKKRPKGAEKKTKPEEESTDVVVASELDVKDAPGSPSSSKPPRKKNKNKKKAVTEGITGEKPETSQPSALAS